MDWNTTEWTQTWTGTPQTGLKHGLGHQGLECQLPYNPTSAFQYARKQAVIIFIFKTLSFLALSNRSVIVNVL